jgi:serine/threonine-protein kinase HipA
MPCEHRVAVFWHLSMLSIQKRLSSVRLKYPMQVRNKLDERKYHGSYELIADLLRNQLGLPQPELEKFFQQIAFSILVRNGDAHLKNFGVLYSSETDIRLAPMFDVLTTSIYKYTRFGTGEEIEDRTMALKLRKGDKTRTYPLAKELLDFGRRACGVDRPQEFILKAADAMAATLSFIRHDERMPKDLAPKLEDAWEYGFALAREVVGLSQPGS